MNVFATYQCPIKSAQILDDKRLIKMILESAQILSTAVYLNTKRTFSDIYKPTHVKHPCVIWASLSNENWGWLYSHLEALIQEYQLRFGKKHKTSKLLVPLKSYKKYIPINKKTNFPNCTFSPKNGIDYRNLKDVNEAYRKYLVSKWNSDIKKPKWTIRNELIT